MAYLIKTTEVYRVETEEQAKNFIEEQKQNDSYEVIKYSSERKDRKVKGEIAEEWMRVTIVKSFTDEKDPVDKVTVKYE
jgi:hypothetical protein